MCGGGGENGFLKIESGEVRFLAVPARNASTLIQCSSREYYYNVVVEYTATVQSEQC